MIQWHAPERKIADWIRGTRAGSVSLFHSWQKTPQGCVCTWQRNQSVALSRSSSGGNEARLCTGRAFRGECSSFKSAAHLALCTRSWRRGLQSADNKVNTLHTRNDFAKSTAIYNSLSAGTALAAVLSALLAQYKHCAEDGWRSLSESIPSGTLRRLPAGSPRAGALIYFLPLARCSWGMCGLPRHL